MRKLMQCFHLACKSQREPGPSCRDVATAKLVYAENMTLIFAWSACSSFSRICLITAAYARPGRMRAGWAYFVSFQQAAKDFAQLSQTKLTMPVLAIGGEKANGAVLGQQMKIVAADATMVVLKNTGHWVLEENPKETTDALMKFL